MILFHYQEFYRTANKFTKIHFFAEYRKGKSRIKLLAVSGRAPKIREWTQQRFHESHAKKNQHLVRIFRSGWSFLGTTSKGYNTDISSNQQRKKPSSVQAKNSVNCRFMCVVCLFTCQTSWLVILWFLQSLTLDQVGYITEEGKVWYLSIWKLKENISQKRIQSSVKHLRWSVLG